MLKRNAVNLLILSFFVILSLVVFRKYVIGGQVPFPANLLVSFYSPWKYEEWAGYPNGPANKPIGFDVLKLFYPYRSYTTERLKDGEMPLWNPYVFSGNVHLATYQSAVFYPLNVVYFALPLIDAWAVLVVVQPILAGYFTYLFLQSLKLGVKSSLFGATVFAFSGWMLAWSEESLVIEHSALWLPLALYGIETLLQKHYTKGFLITVFAFSFSILAGFLQMTIYIGIFSLAWILYRYVGSPKEHRKAVFYFVYAGIMSFLISAIHWIPGAESYFYSPRGIVNAPFVFETYLMKPWHLITFFIPDFWGNPGSYNYFGYGGGFYHEKVLFIGIPAFLLALYVIFNRALKLSAIAFFRWGAISTILLGFFPLGWILYYSSLPIISAMVPSRIFVLTAFSLSVLSGYGIEELLHKKWNISLTRKILLFWAWIFIVAWVFVLTVKLYEPLRIVIDPKFYISHISFRNLFIPTALFSICSLLLIILNRLKNKSVIYYFLFVISIFSSLYFANKFLYFSDRKFVFPETPVITKVKELAGLNRVWGYGNGYIEKNMLSFYEIYSPEGYDALYSQRYGELLNTQETGGAFTDQISRTDATIEQASERQRLLENPYRRRILELLGVRYIIEAKNGEGKDWLTTEDRFPVENFLLAWEDEKFRIWEYRDALPRAFLVRNYVVDSDAGSVNSRIFNSTFNPKDTIILENDPQLSSCIKQNVTTAEIVEYKPEKIRIKTSDTCSSILFLSDTYYPGWKAHLDSKEVPILRANYAFRGVVVPNGDHEVVFTYDPIWYTWGAYISVFSLIIFFPVYLLVKRRLLR